ncbi:XkdX family protein [Leuconostoc citreum]|nr:XkdX family protein [Leuconostoc citreum]MCT3055827.1 XkdX family protein [Leuconostoc citreum]MCT3063229.1 XkdX family protein [Leuconostoc citreum]
MAKFILDYYKMGLYADDNMKVFVRAGYITTDQFKTATGKDYVA